MVDDCEEHEGMEVSEVVKRLMKFEEHHPHEDEEAERQRLEEMYMSMDFIDVHRAFFQAAALRKVFVQLPPEDAEEDMCGGYSEPCKTGSTLIRNFW